MADILDMYIPIVHYMAEAVGPNCEIVLHDVRRLESSVIAIGNSHISGRKVGDPVTDLVLKVLKDSSEYESDSITNYISRSKSGRTFRSSTYFIRDEKHEIIGMLCVNMDLSSYIDMSRTIQELMGIDPNQTALNENHEKNEHSDDSSIHENLTNDIDDIIRISIQKVIGNSSISGNRMVMEEKKEIVKILNEKGIFLLKGTINKVADYLGVSVPTVYRYINEVSIKEE